MSEKNMYVYKIRLVNEYEVAIEASSQKVAEARIDMRDWDQTLDVQHCELIGYTMVRADEFAFYDIVVTETVENTIRVEALDPMQARHLVLERRSELIPRNTKVISQSIAKVEQVEDDQ